MVIISWLLLVIYIVIRVLLLCCYLQLNKHLTLTRFRQGDFNTEHINPYRTQWQRLYIVDLWVKRIGEMVIALVTVVGVICHSDSQYALILAMLPIINNLFDWLGIDEPELNQAMFPIRCSAKIFLKRNPYYKLWSEMDRLDDKMKCRIIEHLGVGNRNLPIKLRGPIPPDRDLVGQENGQWVLRSQVVDLIIGSINEHGKISHNDSDEVITMLKKYFSPRDKMNDI